MRDALEPGQEYDHNLHFGQHLLAELVDAAPCAAAGHRSAVEPQGHRARAGRRRRRARRSRPAAGEATFDGRLGDRHRRRALDRATGCSGLTFEGFTWPDRFVATNIEYPFREFGYPNANMVVDPANWGVIGRLGRENLWRPDLRRGRRASTKPRSSSACPSGSRRSCPIPRCPIGSTTSRPTACTSAAPPASAWAACCWRAMPRMPATRAAGSGLTGGVLDADMPVRRARRGDRRGGPTSALLDFYAEERRRVFVEVTSPMSTNFKRLLSEADPARRQADKAEHVRPGRAAAAPNVRASSLAELIKGAAMPLEPMPHEPPRRPLPGSRPGACPARSPCSAAVAQSGTTDA